MADLTVSYDYLDDLVGTLTQVSDRVRLDDSSANADHSVAGSATVETAGREITKFQAALSKVLSENLDTLTASVGDASTTMAETDTALSTGASGDASSGASSGRGRGGGGAF